MSERHIFHPPRSVGTTFHLILIAGLTIASIWGIWQTANAQVAPQLLLFLVPILLFLLLVPLLIYRLYALYRSRYILERDGVILQWGWRTEVLSMDQIDWIHPKDELDPPLKFPLIRWPGAILGQRRFRRGPTVEFMASQMDPLLVISGPGKYYAISPSDANRFLDTYHHLIELGSLNPLPSQATRPGLVITQLWKRRSVLILTLLGIGLTLSLLVWTLWIIPQRDQISLGFTPQGIPHEPLPSVRLILLPILLTVSTVGNLIIGLFLYHRERNRVLAYLLWGCSVLIGIIFHISMYFIIS